MICIGVFLKSKYWEEAHFTFREMCVLILEAFRSGTGNNSWVSGSKEYKKCLYVTYIHKYVRTYIHTHTHTYRVKALTWH